MKSQRFGVSWGWRGNFEVHLGQLCVPSLSMASLPVVSNLSLNTLHDRVLITSRNHHPIRILQSADCAKLLPHFELEEEFIFFPSPHTAGIEEGKQRNPSAQCEGQGQTGL